MPTFSYKAASANGEVLQGEMEAPDKSTVIRQLQRQGHVPIRAELVASRRAGISLGLQLAPRRVGFLELTGFCMELATMLQAKLPLDRALEVMAEVAPEGPVKALIERIGEKIRAGASMSRAMSEEGKPFDRLHVNLVRAGEASGRLDEALTRLSELLERTRELRSTLTEALIYPVILVLFSIFSLALILGVVVPKLSEMFEDAGSKLPLPTRIVVGLGDFVHDFWWLTLAILAGIVLLLRKQWADPQARRRIESWLFRRFLVGELIVKYETARFTRCLGTLTANGVSLVESLDIARDVIGNHLMRDAVARATSEVREGRGFATALMQSRLFPRLAGRLIQVGEQSGRLQEMLLRLADIYDREVQSSIRRLLSILTPVMILGLGAMIAGIIMSIMIAILRVNQLAL